MYIDIPAYQEIINNLKLIKKYTNFTGKKKILLR